MTPEERFWIRVDKNGPFPLACPSLGPCWLWTGSKRKHGHGHFVVPGICTSAHQFSYHIHNGPIPKGLYVLHHCDNGACVNPFHLFAGTQQENMQGAKERGRMPKGESHYRSAFTTEEVQKIRDLFSSGMRIFEIAKMFGRSRSAIDHIIHDRWQHVEMVEPQKRNFGSKHAGAKLTEQDVRKIRQLRASGEKLQAIADQFGVKIMNISSICNRNSWKHVQ